MRVEVKGGWLLYKTLTSNIIGAKKEFVNLKEIAKWMETGQWCQYYALIRWIRRGHTNLVHVAIHFM
jgi:hypothetical protein